MQPFESAWLKWGMAVSNADVLKDGVLALAAETDLKVETAYATYYDAKRRCVHLVITEIADPFPIHWGLLLGDIVHNYRSCLDHLAWDLFKRGRTPNLTEWQESGVYFPISATRKSFNASLKGARPKLPGVRRADVAIVRRFQPYIPGESRAHRHVFTVLDGLSNLDKHRAIQPVIGVPDRITFQRPGGNRLHLPACLVPRLYRA